MISPSQHKDQFEKKELILLSIVVLVVGVILSYRLTEPWIGLFDFNGAAYSRFAKNFLTFGFLRTKMSPTWDLGSIVPENFNYYLHHPPLLAYIVAMSFKLFGAYELSARLVPIVFSVGSLILFYLIVRLLWDKSMAFLSLVFLGFTPAFLYYGRMVNHEPIFLFFYFLVIYFYLKFLDKRKTIYINGLVVSFIFAFLTAWQAFYLAIILLIHYLVSAYAYKDIKDKRPIIVCILIPILFAFVYILWIYLIKGALSDNINSIISRFGPNERHQFTWIQFLLLEINRVKFLFTKIISIAVLFYIILLVLQRNKSIFREGVNIIFFSLAMLNIFLFREGAWEHDYQLYYFLPFLAVASAKGLLLLKGYLRNTRIFRIFIICFIILFLGESYFNLMAIHSFTFDIDLKIAKKINSITSPNEEIGTNFQISVPTSWYVDRKYTIINSVEEFQKINAERKLAFIILIPKNENKSLIRFLSKKYHYFIYDDFIFYNLRNHQT